MRAEDFLSEAADAVESTPSAAEFLSSKPEAQRELDKQRKALQAEKVSDQFSGFEKITARAGAGVQKAGINAGRMLTAANDLLFLPEITGLFSQSAGNAYRQAVDRDLAYWSKREADTTRDIQQIDDNSVLGQIVEGTSRAVTELPAQVIPGMAARTTAGAVKAASATGGGFQGLSTYGQERSDGRSRGEAIPYAVMSGLITALTTRAFGATGVESIFKNEGINRVGAKVLNVLKQAGMEGAEEAVDQFQQDLLERLARNPNKPIIQSVNEALMAGTIGSLVGGLASGAHAALTPESKPTDFQKAFDKAESRSSGQRAVSAMAFLNQTPPTFGQAADEAQARQENKPLVDLIMKGPSNENPPSAPAQNQVETPSPLPVVEGKPTEAAPAPEAPVGVAQPQGAGQITVAVPTMDFARRLVEMSPEEFVQSAQSFNKVNIELGRNATPEQVEELNNLRDRAQQRLQEIRQTAETSGNPADIENYVRLSTLPQFYNEAIAEAMAKRGSKEAASPVVPKANPNGEQPSAPVASVASKPTAVEAKSVRSDLTAVPPLVVEAQPIAGAPEPLSIGSKARVGNNPQPHTILEETTDPKFPDERIFKVQNDRTKETFETDANSLTPIAERSAEERKATKGRTIAQINAEMQQLGLDPKDFPNKAAKLDAIKREKIKNPKFRAKAEELAKKLDALRAADPLAGNVSAFGLVQDLWNRAVGVAQAVIRAGGTVADAVEAAIEFIRSNHRGDWDEAGATAALEAQLEEPASSEPETIRAQVYGVRGIGQLREVENIAEIRAAIKERVFNATPAVTDARTEDAWRIATELTDEVTKAGHALRYRNEIGGQEMGLPLLRGELFRYAFKLASQGNDTFLRFLLDRSADFQTSTGGGDTTAGRVQRAARELADSAAFNWLREAMDTERRNAAISGARILPQETFLGLVRDMENLQLNPDELEAFLNRAQGPNGTSFAQIVADAIGQGGAPQPPGTPRQPRTRGEQTPNLPGFEAMPDSEAQNTATRILERLQDRHSGVEWLRQPASVNQVREIVRQALQGRLGYAEGDTRVDPILQDPTPIVEKIQQALEAVGVDAETARNLGREIETERQNRWANQRVRQMERASRSNSVRSLIEDILNTPYRAQHDPAWRRQMAIRWFESNGLSNEQATAAADMFNREFEAAYQRAAEKVAQRVLGDGAPKTNEQFERLIRSGVLDPSKPWLDKFAEASGWVKPTPEQFSKIAELEEKLSDPELSPSEVADIVEQQRTILRHVGKKDGAGMRAMAESFTASLLSQAVTIGRTFWVQFAPVFSLLKDFGTAAAFDPKNALNFAEALVTAHKKQGKNQLKYGWQKDAFQFHINDITGSHNELKRVYETTQKLIESDATPKLRKAAARVQQIYALGRFVFRLMNTIDNTQMSVAREWKIVYYSSRAFQEAGLDSPNKISQLIDAMNSIRQSEFERALDEGLDDKTASVRADDRATKAALDFVSGEAGGDYALKVLQAAENDAYNVVGRRAPGIGPEDEGLISKYTINPIMEFASDLRAKGGLGNIIATLSVGMVNIPLRAARAASDFYGYGLIRYGIHKYRTNRGMETFWKQSFSNELQAKHRRNVAVASLVLTALSGLAALKWSTADDEANKIKNGIFVTGSGPKSKNLRDEWIKNGWSPYTLHVVVGGVKIKIPLTRVGEPLFPPFLIAGVIDNVKWAQKDAKAKGKEINLAATTTANLIAAQAQLLGARGLFQSINQYGKLTEGGGGLEKNLARMIGGTAAAIVLPFKSSLSQISEMLIGPLDNSSASAIVANQFPIIGMPWQKPAVNRFGDALYNQSFSGKLERLGVPITLQISGNSPNDRLYTTLIDKGVAPPELRRYVLEERFGELSNDQFSDFAKKSGALLKQAAVSSLSEMQRMTPADAKRFLQNAAERADKTAAAALGLERREKPQAAKATSSTAAAPAAPAVPRSTASIGGGGGARSVRSSASGRIRKSLASFKVPRLKKVGGRIRSRISRGFKRFRVKSGRIRRRIASRRRMPRIRKIRFAI